VILQVHGTDNPGVAPIPLPILTIKISNIPATNNIFGMSALKDMVIKFFPVFTFINCLYKIKILNIQKKYKINIEIKYRIYHVSNYLLANLRKKISKVTY